MALSIDQMDLTNNGFDVGIVMQRDTVRRPVGDVGNAKSYPISRFYIAKYTTPQCPGPVRSRHRPLAAPEPWVEAARDLERAGVKGHQRRLWLHGDTPAGHGCRRRHSRLHLSAFVGTPRGATAGPESTHRHHDREQPGAGRRVLPGIGVVLGGHSRRRHRT